MNRGLLPDLRSGLKEQPLPRLRQFILPAGVLLLATAFAGQWIRLPASAWALLRVYSWFILGLGLLLAWAFQRSRVALGLLALALAGEALRRSTAGALTPSSALHAAFPAHACDLLAILLPLNLAILAGLPERGFWTPRVLGRLSLILTQAGLVLLAAFFPWPPLAAAVRARLFHPPLLLLTPLHQPALLAFSFALVLALLRFWRQPRPIEAGFVAALAAAFLALHFAPSRPQVPVAMIFVAAAQTVLVLGVLLTSHAMAYRDELTGLASRRALSEFLPQLGRRYSIAMVDVDHFKKFNDRYGHDAGDQVLRLVASKLASLPGSGRVFRYGGEEFAIIYPGRSLDETADHFEHIRKSIEQGRFMVRGPQRPRRARSGRPMRGRSSARTAGAVRITVSIGMAEAGARLADPQAVIKAADKALYRAKKAGRNQISE